MDVQRINSVLSRAIMGLQGGEIEAMLEAMAIGDLSSYDVPSPSQLAKAKTYKVPSPARFGFKKPRKVRKPRKQSGKLSAAQKKKLIAKIYKALPRDAKTTMKDAERGGYRVKARLKDGGRRMVHWGRELGSHMGKGLLRSDYLDELSDAELLKMADWLESETTAMSKISGLKFNQGGDRLLTKVSGAKLLGVLERICAEHSGLEVNGVLIDGSSACLIVQIAKKLNAENKKKFLALPVGRMGELAWQIASSGGGVGFKSV